MHKIYSRPRIRIPKIVINRGISFKNKNNKKALEIIFILIIAFSVVKFVLTAVSPVFDTLCENRAKSIATIISNEQATNVMKNYTYDDLFIIEKDSNENITMIKSNVINMNKIISDVAIKIQEAINNKGRDDISIALR